MRNILASKRQKTEAKIILFLAKNFQMTKFYKKYGTYMEVKPVMILMALQKLLKVTIFRNFIYQNFNHAVDNDIFPKILKRN